MVANKGIVMYLYRTKLLRKKLCYKTTGPFHTRLFKNMIQIVLKNCIDSINSFYYCDLPSNHVFHFILQPFFIFAGNVRYAFQCSSPINFILKCII